MPWSKGEPECGGSELGGPPPHALLRQTLWPLPLERAAGLGPEAGWPSRPVPSPPPRGGLCFRLVPDRPTSPTYVTVTGLQDGWNRLRELQGHLRICPSPLV